MVGFHESTSTVSLGIGTGRGIGMDTGRGRGRDRGTGTGRGRGMKLDPKWIETQSQKWAQSFVRRLPLARHLVDELAQEAAIGILRAAQKFNSRKGRFGPYAQTWAFALMRRHVNWLGGPVSRHKIMPHAVSLIAPEEKHPSDNAIRDEREEQGFQFEEAAFSEAFDKLEPKIQAIVQARMAGKTNEAIAELVGVSRETIRQKCLRFAESLSE